MRYAKSIPLREAVIIYRGYLIEPDFTKTTWFAKRDGVAIYSASSIEKVKAALDALCDPV